MNPATLEGQQMILEQLCMIRQLLQKCCEAPSCKPSTDPDSFPKLTTSTLSTTPTRILGNNPNRLSFTIMNAANTQKIFLSPFSQPAATAKPTVVVAAQSSSPITAYTVPASVTTEWYAWSDSGTPTIGIQEDLLTGK